MVAVFYLPQMPKRYHVIGNKVLQLENDMAGMITISLVWCLALTQVNLEGWGNTLQT